MQKKPKYKYVEISIQPQNKEDNEKLRQFLNSRLLLFPDGTRIDDYLNSKEFLKMKYPECKFIIADESGIGFIATTILYMELNVKNNKNFIVFTHKFAEFKEKYLENFSSKNKRS